MYYIYLCHYIHELGVLVTMTYSCITSRVSSRRPGSPGQRRRTRDQFPLCLPPPRGSFYLQRPRRHCNRCYSRRQLAKNKQQSRAVATDDDNNNNDNNSPVTPSRWQYNYLHLIFPLLSYYIRQAAAATKNKNL